MVVRRKLSDLVSDLVPEEQKVTELQNSDITESVTSDLSTQSQDLNSSYDQPTKTTFTLDVTLAETKLQSYKVTKSVTSEVPKYETFDRKEARLRADQTERLTKLTKSLNRKRKGRGERITDNTLIRIAVDLLLSKEDILEGTTEEEIKKVLDLRSSVSL